jgi:flagellar hook-associated protein FlgK
MNPGKAMDALNSVAVTIANLFNKLNTDKNAYCINPNDTTKLMKTNSNNYIFGNLVPKIDPNTNQQVIDPVTGNPVYELEDITAENISVNSNLLTDKGIWNIACAHFDNPNNLDPPPTFNENAIGNAQNVVLMLGTRNAKVAELGNMSVEDFYTGLLGKVAASGSNMETLVETQTSVVDSIHNKILSNNSVDINEELVDLVKYQTAYSAAAKVFTTCNSCLDTLMALGG